MQAAVQADQAVGAEERPAGRERLDRGAHLLQPLQQRLGGVGHGTRIGGHELQPRAAGERLADPHPGRHPEGGGGGVRLADRRRPARLRAERGRLGRQCASAVRPPPAARSGGRARRR